MRQSNPPFLYLPFLQLYSLIQYILCFYLASKLQILKNNCAIWVIMCGNCEDKVRAIMGVQGMIKIKYAFIVMCQSQNGGVKIESMSLTFSMD